MKAQQLELEKEFSQVQALCPEQGNARPFYSRNMGDPEQRGGFPKPHTYCPTQKQDHMFCLKLHPQLHTTRTTGFREGLSIPRQAHSDQAVVL